MLWCPLSLSLSIYIYIYILHMGVPQTRNIVVFLALNQIVSILAAIFIIRLLDVAYGFLP